MRAAEQADIKAYWSRNVDHFHLSDSPSDLLHLILKSVQSMDEEEAYGFLQYQMERTTGDCRAKISSILKNPHLLQLFSNLTKWPMFESAKLINFNRIYLWRKIVPCWLDIFLDYTQDTYCYLASPTDCDVQTLLDVKNHTNLPFAYSLFTSKFHDIVDEAYKVHLAPSYLAFGAPGGTITNKGNILIDWNTSFAKYREEIISNLAVWANETSHPPMYSGILAVFVERLQYILDEAYKTYPMISNLGTPLPLASNTFIQDIGTDLFSSQDAIIEVSFVY